MVFVRSIVLVICFSDLARTLSLSPPMALICPDTLHSCPSVFSCRRCRCSHFVWFPSPRLGVLILFRLSAAAAACGALPVML